MRPIRFALLLACLTTPIFAQNAATMPAANPAVDLNRAILGRWTGVLEYRDYAEPPASAKRVQLPTWLAITAAPEGVFLDYTYDDGPSKVIAGHSALAVDLNTQTYTVIGTDAVLEKYVVTGAEKLRGGRGELTLTGIGKDSGKPADIRITWTVRRNLLSWLQEVRPAGSAEAFTFRHRYTFTRAEAPQLTATK